MTTLPEYTPYYGGGQVRNPANVIKASGLPSETINSENRLGTLAVDNATGTIYGLASKLGNVDNWVVLASNSGGDSAASFTATNGNFIASTAGTGLLLNSPTATGVAASPLVVNGRSGQAVFTTVSIAAASDLTLTITNSAITASTTQVIYSMSGVTTGAALSIKSVTNSAGSSAIVVTNGTGATTSVSNITLNFLVVN